MKEFLKENWFKLGIIIIILVLVFLTYYSLVIRPEQLKVENQNMLQVCLDIADIDYASDWATACATNAKSVEAGYDACLKGADGYAMTATMCRNLLGTPDNSATCTLPTAMANQVNTYHTENKADCYKQHPQS